MRNDEAYTEQAEVGAGGQIRVEIFDPPMCCPTGVCGPALDPALLDIYGAVLKIRTEYDGRAVVERYVLGQQPARFMQEPEVIRRLKETGIGVPLTLVNGVVVKENVYPSYDELRRWIEEGDGSSPPKRNR